MCGTPAQLPPQLVIEPNPIAPVLVVGPPLFAKAPSSADMDSYAWWYEYAQWHEKLNRPIEGLNDLISFWAQMDFFVSQTRKDMMNYFGSDFMSPTDKIFAYTFTSRCRVIPESDQAKMTEACSIYTRSLLNDGRKAVITIGQAAKDQVSAIIGGAISSTPTSIGGFNTIALPAFNPEKKKQHALVMAGVEDFIKRTL